MKRKKLVSILTDNGFYPVRESGHQIFSNGKVAVSVPRHIEINEYTAKKILKEAGI